MSERDERAAQMLADFILNEAGEIAHDMAHHVGDQVFDVLKRHGLMMRSEAGATGMLVITAAMILEQAINQCSRAAEEDCRAAVVKMFLSQVQPATANELNGIDLSDAPETTDLTGAQTGRFAKHGAKP